MEHQQAVLYNSDIRFVNLKPEYLFRNDSTQQKERDSNGGPKKKQKLDGDDSKVSASASEEEREFFWRRKFGELCQLLMDVGPDEPMPTCTLPLCRGLHDIGKYLESKKPDIGPECFVFKLKGRCPKGVACRWGSGHITESGRNMTNAEVQRKYLESCSKTITYLTPELQQTLSKREYNFKRSDEVLISLPKAYGPYQAQSDIDFTEDVDFGPTPQVMPVERMNYMDERLGPCTTTTDFRNHLAKKKKINWKDKLYMPGSSFLTNLPFRRIIKEFGADITCSEPLVATNIVEGYPFDWRLVERHQSEDVYGLHVVGTNPHILTQAAQLLTEKTDADFIELDYGMNPVPWQYNPAPPPSVLKCMTRVTNKPLTVCLSAHDINEVIVKTIRDCGVSMLHVYDRKQFKMTWDIVAELPKQMPEVPVICSSDIFTYEEYRQTKENYPQMAGFLLERAALVKPWVFTEIKEQRAWDISSNERFEILKKFVNYGLEFWGSTHKGVERTRKFLLDWMQLLGKYIPLGLLEDPPQQMYDRSAKYIGRNDLETLMGSFNPMDAVKITEMLLGPVPEGFIPPTHWRHRWPPRS